MSDLGISNDDLDAVSKSILITPEPKEEAPEDDSSDEAPEGDDTTTPTDTQDYEEPSDDESEASDEPSDDEVDIDEVDIDVVVDGKTKTVKLKDLKAKYSGEAAIEGRLQEVTETKAKVLNVGNALYKVLNEQSERLRKLDQVLQEQAKPPINWEELRVKDPGKYLLERDNAMRIEERRRQLDEENKRISEQKAHLESLRYQEFAESQAKELTRKIPEITDPEKSKVIMQDLAEASKYYGFSQEEMGAVVDHRHLMVLIDAAKYRKMMGQKSEKSVDSKVKLLKARPLVKASTTNKNSMPAAKKTELAIIKKAKNTGHVDDVAKLLMVRKKV